MTVAYEILHRLMTQRQSAMDAWRGKSFEKMKLISATEKGDIAEDFLAEILKAHSYQNVEVKKGRRGHYDVSLDKKVFFEVKAATLDISKGFQFNGVRYDTKYTHLFCLGVTPDNLYYLIVNKAELINGTYHLVSMTRGANATFKLSRRLNQLHEFGMFVEHVDKAVKETEK